MQRDITTARRVAALAILWHERYLTRSQLIARVEVRLGKLLWNFGVGRHLLPGYASREAGGVSTSVQPKEETTRRLPAGATRLEV